MNPAPLAIKLLLAEVPGIGILLAGPVAPATGGWDVGTALSQIGIGALIAGPVFWWALAERKERRALQDEVKALNTAALAKSDGLLRDVGNAVTASTAVIDRVTSAMDTTIARASTPPGTNDQDRMLRRLELVVDELKRGIE